MYLNGCQWIFEEGERERNIQRRNPIVRSILLRTQGIIPRAGNSRDANREPIGSMH
jgi:hypothetical protein